MLLLYKLLNEGRRKKLPIWNERIHERRIEKGITLAQVAEMLGVTEATAQRYECGNIKNIPYEQMCAYGEILNCSPAYLMGWEKDLKRNEENNTQGTEEAKVIKMYSKLVPEHKKAVRSLMENLLDCQEKYNFIK